ncbi:MAG: WYL domain-containing protein [Deltaproteobacteria bacterium]|nr:WYL domain-containing protein [Deltaproteobacteria bacterium]
MSLERHWYILQSVPGAPQSIDTASLRKRLDSKWGVKTSMRNLQRDLVALSLTFPLTCDEDQKPFRWSFMENSELFQLPKMNLNTALTLRLVEEMLAKALPSSTTKHLEKYFKTAKSTLKLAEHSGYKKWAERVKVLPRTQGLQPAQVKPKVYDAVYEALLEEKQLEVNYKGRGDGDAKLRTLHPLGLVLREGATYLVCTYFDYDDVRYLPLQRFSSAKVLNVKRKAPKDFSLASYLSTGKMGFLVGEEQITFEALVSEQLAKTLSETPLSAEQEIVDDADGRMRLQANVADTLALQGWIMSYGSHIEVLSPAPLRTEIAKRYKEGAALYPTEND